MGKKWYFVLTLTWLVCACSSDSSDVPSDDMGIDQGAELTFDRKAMLINWTDNIIVPSYKELQSDLLDLKTAFDAFVAVKNVDNLVIFRQAWADAYISWQGAAMFEIGPAEANGYRSNMNTFPTDTTLIASFIDSGSYDFSLSSNRDAKGFPALDYLLNGLEGTDEELVARWAEGTEADNTMDLIEAILVDMLSLTDTVVSGWEDGYRNTFVENDGSSATASADRFVNDYIFYYEKFLRAGKMGIPLGVFSGTPQPATLEVYYRPELGKSMFLAGMDAVQDFFNGKHYGSNTSGESLASYLDDLNTLKNGDDLSQLINAQFDLARGMVQDLGSFRDEIEQNSPPTNMLLAYDEVQRIVPYFKVDMVSAMSISIDYVDADGD
ncbi:imelysin family protein [Flagellimonas sp. MMG031]|uniref:Imelysin family protein n=1 Tax=Flagellimonas sp. MMG031 TaxID=3158549 RepID=A0AAU7MX55_9FLAO